MENITIFGQEENMHVLSKASLAQQSRRQRERIEQEQLGQMLPVGNFPGLPPNRRSRGQMERRAKRKKISTISPVSMLHHYYQNLPSTQSEDIMEPQIMNECVISGCPSQHISITAIGSSSTTPQHHEILMHTSNSTHATTSENNREPRMEEANNYNRIREAVKAKMQLQDYTGARSLIREALETSPQFDQATEMLTVCDILCSAGIQLPGIGVNWYWVLQLYASAEPSIIDDQYRELVSLLDPIKNDFPGTGLALNFIEDAYSVLSDPVKRAIYDSKRNCTENASDDSNKAQDIDVVNASNAATAEVAVGAIDLGASSSKSKWIVDEVCNGSGSARRSTEDLDCNGKRKLCAQESCVETAPRISDCSDEASFTHMPNPSTNMMDTCGSTGGIQIGPSKWSPKNFVTDQVWAVYDGPDAMPRLYAKVINVFSQSEVCVTFLELNPMIDEEIQWVEEGLPVVCGIFRAGGGTTILEMSRFSHIVNCDTSSRKSFYRIFPQKGEVWAMYKNWNFKWKQTDHIPYECRLVEILSDYSEENGLTICSLVEVNGRLTFFQRQLHEGFQLTRQLSRLEMLSFSHRIPAFAVRGVKDSDIPKGSLHLEPDALPPKVFD